MAPDFHDKYLIYMMMGSMQFFGVICAFLIAVGLGVPEPEDEMTISLAVSVLSGQAIGGLIAWWLIGLRRK
jgi:hypothetical protein